jgi:hypothetical protein
MKKADRKQKFAKLLQKLEAKKAIKKAMTSPPLLNHHLKSN